MTISVYQGEREMAADNKHLGQFNLEGIAPAPRGVPQIEVAFDIDANGIVKVSAKDKATGKEQEIKIQASGGLDDSDIERMVEEAEAHAEDDKKRRESVETRNQGEALVHGARKAIDDLGDKADPDARAEVETGIETLQTALDGEDMEDIKTKSAELSQSMMKMGEAAYQAGQEASGDTGTGDSRPRTTRLSMLSLRRSMAMQGPMTKNEIKLKKNTGADNLSRCFFDDGWQA